MLIFINQHLPNVLLICTFDYLWIQSVNSHYSSWTSGRMVGAGDTRLSYFPSSFDHRRWLSLREWPPVSPHLFCLFTILFLVPFPWNIFSIVYAFALVILPFLYFVCQGFITCVRTWTHFSEAESQWVMPHALIPSEMAYGRIMSWTRKETTSRLTEERDRLDLLL